MIEAFKYNCCVGEMLVPALHRISVANALTPAKREEILAAWHKFKTSAEAEFSTPAWKPIDPAQTALPGV